MKWVAPAERDAANQTLEKRLWEAADQLRANSGLTSAQYSTPVLGLIFLRFAEARFAKRRSDLESPPSPAKAGEGRGEGQSRVSRRGTSRIDDPAAYHAEGVVYLTPNARYDRLLSLPEGENVGKEVNDAMADIEKHNPQLAGVLPRTYQIFNSTLLKELLKKVSEIPANLDFDAFGRIYEYFLGEFARTEGQKGGEFFTPSSNCPPDCANPGTVSWPSARSSLRFRRYVRAERPLRPTAQDRFSLSLWESLGEGRVRVSRRTQGSQVESCPFTARNGSAPPLRSAT